MTISPAALPSVTPGTVVFNSVEFLASYPQFNTVPVAALQGNFNLGCLQLNNSAASVVQDAPTRQYLLYLLTAHITQLLNGVNGQPASGVVGRISSAAQGSVSMQAEWAAQVSGSASFYLQTPFGAIYWQATLQYRSARYVRPCYSDVSSPWNAWPQ